MNAPSEGIIYRPGSAVFWVFVLALGFGFLGVLQHFAASLQETLESSFILIPVWFVFIALLVRLLMMFDPLRSMRSYPQILVAGVAMGATTALSMALIGSQGLVPIMLAFIPADIFQEWNAALTAPLMEEASKAACAAVILVLCARITRRISHALMVGMFVGLGFDLAEDLVYQTSAAINHLGSDLDGATQSLATRILTAIPSHWAFTGLSSVGILLLLPSYALRESWSPLQRILVALALLFCAWLMHFIWNSPMPDMGEDDELLIASIVLLKVFFNLLLFIVIALLLMREERRWVAEQVAAHETTDSPLPFPVTLLASLPTRAGRRAFRHQIYKKAGRDAARQIALLQQDALDAVQNNPAPSLQ